MIGTKTEMDEAGIYRITIGENFYFGSARCFKKRKWNHIKDLRSGMHSNRHMQHAYNKHKEILFEIIEVVECGQPGFNECLLSREQHHIDRHFSDPRCMNICPTAGNTSGVKHTDESRANMSKAHIGLNLGMFHPLFGKPRSEETKEKLRKSLKGIVPSDDQRKAHLKACRKKSRREAISKALTGRTQTPETIEKRMLKVRGGLHYRAKAVWVEHESFGRVEKETIGILANAIGVRRVDLNRWINGSRSWPGSGFKKKGKYSNINGMIGGYLT